MSRHLFAVVLFAAAAACDRPDSPESSTSRAQLADARATCVKLFERQRACTDAFIPALVELRQQLDQPAGIARRPRTEVIGAALAEWKSDSTDQRIAATCERLAPQLPAPAVAEAGRCTALGGCADFVGCAIPLLRHQLAK